MKLRLTYAGVSNVVTLPNECTVGDVRAAAVKEFKLDGVELRVGFPPTAIVAADSTAASAAGVSNGVQVHVLRRTPPPVAAPAPPAPSTSARAAAVVLPAPSVSASWSCTVCTYLNSAGRSSCEMCGTRHVAPPPAVLERHVVPADNSCLFTSLGYVLRGRRMDTAPAMRAAIASHILTHSGKYDAAILGQSPDAYAAYVRRPEMWGGGIECAVVSDMEAVQIVAVDIKTAIPQLFGQPPACTRRVLLLYDGIHWDALQRVQGSTVTTVFDMDDDDAIAQAVSIAGELRRKHDFTDMANFTLRCLVCRDGIRGEAGAREHAAATGHQNFAEYSADGAS